jgi:hypothetical protein
MTAERLRAMDDEALIGALRDMGPAIAWPEATDRTPDPATRVRAAIVAGDRRARPIERRSWWARPMTRALVLALVALLALVAIAGAVGLGLPGLRLLFSGGPAPSAPPTPAPSATAPAGAPGTGLGLGTTVPLAELEAVAGRPITVPDDALLGPPDAAWVDRTKANQVALVWAARPDLPATHDPGVGLIVMSFDGTIHDEFFGKAINSGTTVEDVRVAGQRGYWISDLPHVFFYDSEGGTVDDARRWVGDALLWSDGTTTWRIESALGRAETMRIAESIVAAGS